VLSFQKSPQADLTFSLSSKKNNIILPVEDADTRCPACPTCPVECLPSGMHSLFNRGNAYFIGVAPRETPGLRPADGTGMKLKTISPG